MREFQKILLQVMNLAVCRMLLQLTGSACTKVQMTALGQTAYTFLFLVCFKAVAGRTAVWRGIVGSWGMDWKWYGTKRGAL
jgi:hypothetical protein